MLHENFSNLHELHDINAACMSIIILMYMHVSCNMHVACMDLGCFPCMLHAQHVQCMLEIYSTT